MGHSPPGSSVHEITQAKHRSGFPVFFFPVFHVLLKGIFQTQGLNPTPWLASGFFTTQPPGKLGRGWFLHTWFSAPGGLGVVPVSRTKKLPEGGSCEPLAASTHNNSKKVAPDKGNRGHQSSVGSMTGFLLPPLETFAFTLVLLSPDTAFPGFCLITT